MKEKAVVPAIDDPLEIVRSVALTEDDYLRAGLRPRARKGLPEIRTFDTEDSALRISQGFLQHWIARTPYEFDPSMPREEAIMLLHAIMQSETKWRLSVVDYTQTALTSMPKEQPHGKLNIPDYIWDTKFAIICGALFKIYSPATFVKYLALGISNRYCAPDLVEYLRTDLLPYATDDEFAQMQDALLPVLTTKEEPNERFLLFATAFRLFEPVIALLGKPETKIQQHFIVSLHVVLSLGDAEAIKRNYWKLGCRSLPEKCARQWLAAAGVKGLDAIAGKVGHDGNDRFGKEDTEIRIKAAALVLAPETAEYMLKWQMKELLPVFCKKWFEANPKHTAAGLTPLVAGNDNRLAASAAAVLRNLVRYGHERIVRAHLETLPPEIFERESAAILEAGNANAGVEPFDDTNTPEALRVEAGSKVKPKPGDPFPGDIPAVVIETMDGPRRLNDVQYYTLLSALQKSKLEAPQPYISAVKGAATRQSCDEFARALLDKCLTGVYVPENRWQILSAGFIGGDRCVAKLAPQIRKWPRQGRFGLAATGLKCLEAIDNDAAMFEVNDIGQKADSPGVKAIAVACMEGFASKRGMTRGELEDRLTPDCGLDHNGSRTFDFGPRQFQVELLPELKPILREIKDGKALPKYHVNIPRPNKKDDPALSGSAVDSWKEFKPLFMESVKANSVRLERAMVDSRRWQEEEFQRYMVRQPLMTILTRMLIWGAYDEYNTLLDSFRVTEDFTYATPQDNLYKLPAGATIGLVHPTQLSSTVKSAWNEVWDDYEMFQPFHQLRRPIYTLQPAEEDAVELNRFDTMPIAPGVLVYPLQDLEWTRFHTTDGQHFGEHIKAFPASGISAVVQYTPMVEANNVGTSVERTITGIFFTPLKHHPTKGKTGDWERIPLRSVDPIAISEVIADITGVLEKRDEKRS